MRTASLSLSIISILSIFLMGFTEYAPPVPVPDENSKPIEFVPKIAVPDETAPVVEKPVEVAPPTPAPYLPQPKAATEADKELTTPAPPVKHKAKTVHHTAHKTVHKKKHHRYHCHHSFFFF